MAFKTAKQMKLETYKSISGQALFSSILTEIEQAKQDGKISWTSQISQEIWNQFNYWGYKYLFEDAGYNVDFTPEGFAVFSWHAPEIDPEDVVLAVD